MKKCIKTIFCLLFVGIHAGVELYPTVKLLAKKYVAQVGLEPIWNAKPIAKYMSQFSTEEKEEVLSFVKTFYQTKN